MNKLSPSQIEKLKEIGTSLRQKRLERSMSLEQIAASTHIRLALLRALEEGQVDQLPELIYIQGFIRRYGQMLQVDGDALAKTLSQQSDEPPTDESVTPDSMPKTPPQAVLTRSVQPRRLIQSRSTNFKKVYWLSAFILLGTVAGALYFLSRPPVSKSDSNSKTPSPSLAPKTPSPAPLKTSVSPSPLPKKAVPLSATVKLEDSSWLKVVVDGQPKFEGVLPKGTQKTWQAQKQLRIRAGNAGVVSLSVNEKPPQRLGRLGEVKEVILPPKPSSQ